MRISILTRRNYQLPLMMLALLLASGESFADNYNPGQSPFGWSARIHNSESKERPDMTYEGSAFNYLLEHGVESKALNTKCSFEFDKGLQTIEDRKESYYDERTWISCRIGDVQLEFAAVGCSYNAASPEFDTDSESPRFTLGSNSLTLDVRCVTNKLKFK